MQTNFNCSGFTLLEALVTLVILSFGLAAIVRLQTALLIEGQQTKALAEAATLARSQLETLRFEADLYPTTGEPASGQITHRGTHESYIVQWKLGPDPDATFSRVEVQVTWTDRFGSHTTRLATLFTDSAGLVPALPPPE